MSKRDLHWITNYIWGIADVVTGKLDVRDTAAELPKVDPLAEEDLDDTIDATLDSNLEKHAAVKEMTL